MNLHNKYSTALKQRAVYTPLRGKRAYLPEWQKNPLTLDDISDSQNVGLLLEHAGLTDLDLDSTEAQYAVPAFLDIGTLAVGRGGTIARYLYEGAAENRTYKDLNGDVLLEVRHAGKQTMWAGSTHPDTGETIEVMRDVHPLPMPHEEAICKAATSALIARHLPDGGRHDLAMAYAGFLLRKGLQEQEVFDILWTAWELNNPSRDADRDLWNIVKDTAEKIAQDKPATGGNTLTQMIPGMTHQISEYWGWDQLLTHEEKIEQERQERAEKARRAWQNPEVQKIARTYDVLDKFRGELKTAGVVGEDRPLKLLFLSAHSRLLDRPISVAVKGPSSAGKSYAVENAVLNVLAEDSYVFLTGMSEKSLIYSETDYRHKMLVIPEQAGVDSDYLDYLLRTLLSENVIRYQVTEKVDGKFVVTEKEKVGPTGLIVSTTKSRLHPENETRILSIWMTDTREQTKAVMKARVSHNKRVMNSEPWKEYAQWLAGQDNRVWVSYSEALAEEIEAYDVRQRRDITLLLNAVETSAIMHQAKRERDHHGRIVASLRDYEIARDLLNDLLSEGIGATVSQTIRETVGAVKELTVDADKEHTTNAALEKKLNLGKGSVSTRVNNALASGYLVNLQEPGKRGNKLALGAELPEDACLLPTPEQLLNATVCNIVRLFVSKLGGYKTAAILPALVRFIVRPESRTNASVPDFEKPYDLRLDENVAYMSQESEDRRHETAAESDEPLPSPKPIEQTNNVTKPSETVTSAAADELSERTKLQAEKVEEVARALLESQADLCKPRHNLPIRITFCRIIRSGSGLYLLPF
jgi:hypothetical protein